MVFHHSIWSGFVSREGGIKTSPKGTCRLMENGEKEVFFFFFFFSQEERLGDLAGEKLESS